jgi:sialate O-acetylesterase
LKSSKKYYTVLCILSLLLYGRVMAAIELPKIIGSNMVLQRNVPVTIWGIASPGEYITVTFHKQVRQTNADEQGKWMVVLAPMEATDQAAVMVISGTNIVKLDNILVGEVWLCSGQSNMEYTMTKSSKYAIAAHSKGLSAEELKKETNSRIRLFLVKRDLNKRGDINKGWQQAEGAGLGAFSAAGYYFAKKLHQELKVPVGIISSSISGSAIEPWMSAEVKKDSLHVMQLNEQSPGKFYAGMIKPLAPFALKGFLWYQGETNCFLKETSEYSFKFRHLINSWRRLWGAPHAPFYFVQIAPFNYSKSKSENSPDPETLPAFREAQAQVLDLPATGMVITTDLADNLEDIHPTYKWEVGRRLALLALTDTYARTDIVSSGPVFMKSTVKGNEIEIYFKHTGKGLVSKDEKPLNWFSIAGEDGKFFPAEAVIKADKVVVSSPLVSNPVNVRFAWHEAAQPNLFNADGLPAAPFRTDQQNYSTAKVKMVKQ